MSVVDIQYDPNLVLSSKPKIAVKRNNKDPNRDLKIGIWIYFLLLIFEGALRKWFLPFLATPLLIVRDPVAIWLVVKCWQRGYLPKSVYITSMLTIGVISIFTAVFFGHGNLLVALFGARPFLIHFPLVFVIGNIFTREDVIKIGKAILWITIPMTVLIGMQFYSPQSAWVNRGVGGDMAGAGYSGANGFFRPPATFSFTTGTTAYYSFAMCYIFYFLFDLKSVNKLVLLGSFLGLIAAIPFSISRALLYQSGITIMFAVLAASRKPKYLGKMIVAFAAAIVLIIALSQLSFLQKPIEAFTERFTSAGTAEGGAIKGTLGNRFTSSLLLVFGNDTNLPYFGYGSGMGTKVGSMLLSGSSNIFLIAEDEWPRLVGEMGVVLGAIVIIIRIALTLKISINCYKKLAKGDFLPWMLLSFGLITLIQMGWSQPTYLGFYVMTGGFLLASFKDKNIIKKKQMRAFK